MRMLPRSLHTRMLVLSAAATLIALVLASWVIAGVLGRFVTEGLDQRLDAEVALLASALDPSGNIDKDKIRQGLGALRGSRGWRWQIRSPDGTIGSADFPVLDADPRRPVPPPFDDATLHPLDGETEHGVHVHAREVTIKTRRGPVTITAAAPRDVVSQPIRGALVPLLLALATLAGLLGAATFIQLRLGLRPLRRLRDQVAEIRNGTRDGVDEDQPSELQPLAAELNALARDNAAALVAARLSAANLAHALKTPVANLTLDVRHEPARAVQVARIEATIRHHLARARAEAVNARTSTLLGPAIDDLVATVSRLHAGRSLVIDVDVAEGLVVAVDPQDLDELVGNLLDNAARYAVRRVIVRSDLDSQNPRHVRIEICDDGPGIAIVDRARVAQPGTRLDERQDGHGFGLSIVAELVALYGGTMLLDEARGGGLSAQFTVPAGAKKAVSVSRGSSRSNQDALR